MVVPLVLQAGRAVAFGCFLGEAAVCPVPSRSMLDQVGAYMCIRLGLAVSPLLRRPAWTFVQLLEWV